MPRGNRIFVAPAMFGLVIVMLACGSENSTAPSTSPASQPTSTASRFPDTPDLPTSLDDPRCRVSTGTALSQAGNDSVFTVSLQAPVPSPASIRPLATVRPLSTPTASPGSINIHVHSFSDGGWFERCIEAGKEASFSFGGNHDYGRDLLLRLELDISEGLTAVDRRTQETVTGMWSKEFSLTQVDPKSISTGTTTFILSSGTPGRYGIVLNSEWLELESMEPIDAPNQTETMTFTYYVLAE